MKKPDILIIGSGIVGLTIARAIKARFPASSVLVLEKEDEVARHSSGRNSGVLHAGFYYTADSLKAKFTRKGNIALKEYCKENGLRLHECGKVVVAKNESEIVSLFELEKRGKKNDVPLRIITEQELNDIEPNARTYQYALHSPTTATVDPEEVCMKLKEQLMEEGVEFQFNEGFHLRIKDNVIKTTGGKRMEAGIIINAAGLYADKIARQFNFCDDYTIIPFKGVYLKYTFDDQPINTNIYPVPNLKNPFLGVHFTVAVDGTIKIGPTSVPAFWRENYKGLKNFSMNEFSNILSWESNLFFSNAFGFRNLAFEEMRKYARPFFIRKATSLVKKINKKGFREWSKPGIRAQLLNIKTDELVQDFRVEGDKKSIHVLNAVSPAFTSSFPFADWIVENYVK